VATADLDASAAAVAIAGADGADLITPPLEWREQLFLLLKKEITNWATEAQSTGNSIFYWSLMSDEQFRDVAAHPPTTVAELSAIETMKGREDFVKDYGSQMVDIVRRFIESRPMKRPMEHVMGLKDSSPIKFLKFPTVASHGCDDFPLAAVASNMNTPLIAGDSMQAPVALNNNTPGGAVAAAAAVTVESAQVCDNSLLLAGVVAQKTDADVSDSENPASEEIEKAAAAVASNMNTPLIAGSVSMHEGPIAPNNNTPGGAATMSMDVCSVAAVKVFNRMEGYIIYTCACEK
jgi:hypothetical protein